MSAAAKKNWMEKLQTMDGALTEARDVHATVIQSPSPSFNFAFGGGWGLPLGYSLVLYGPPKSGKSLMAYLLAGQCHRDYEDGYVIKFDTEYRAEAQLSQKKALAYGIDLNRYMAIESNHPADIYDQIETKVAKWCAEGMPLKLVIIDSMSGVQGRRAAENDGGIMQQQIGDVALTNKEGLKRVLPVQREHKFALIMTSHVAVEMDPLEQRRGNKYKIGASIGVQHHTEYFMYVEPDKRKDSKKDLLGQEFLDASRKDMNDNSERTGHKIIATMKDSTLGPPGRVAEFTFDYNRGIVNQHEEIYLLGVNRGIIRRPNNQTYEFAGWPPIRGEANFVEMLRKNKDMQEAILKELRRQDVAGLQVNFDQVAEQALTAGMSDAEASTLAEK